MQRMRASLRLVSALSLLQAADCAAQPNKAVESAPICRSATYPLLMADRSRYRSAIAAAHDWLDGLDIDPMALRKKGIKGKKKLVEQLDAYARLFETARPTDKPRLMRRIRQ